MYPTLTKQLADDHIRELRRSAPALRHASLHLRLTRRPR
jgi:hypothetical protein